MQRLPCWFSQKVRNLKKYVVHYDPHSVKIGCDVATPEQVFMGDQLQWVGREEAILGKDVNMKPHRSMQEPECDISTQKGEVSFKQWVFEVKSDAIHTEASLR